MDDDQESIEPNVSIEELENRLLALKKVYFILLLINTKESSGAWK